MAGRTPPVLHALPGTAAISIMFIWHNMPHYSEYNTIMYNDRIDTKEL